MPHGKPYLLKSATLQTLCHVFKNKHIDGEQTEQVEGIAANAAHPSPWVSDGVGIVPINGILMNGFDMFLSMFGGISYGEIRAAIDTFEKDPNIKTIMLDINSPGGDAFGVAELAEYIHGIEKPVHAYVSGEAASAAYWLVSAADRIMIHRTGFVGAIGTRVAFFKPNKDFEVIIVSEQSPKKVPDLDSDEGIEQIREHLNTLSAHFISDIAMFRGTDEKIVAAKFGQGDIVNSENALQNGMVDSIGNFQTALDVARGAETLTGQNQTVPPQMVRQKGQVMAKRVKRTRTKAEFVIVDNDTLTEEVEQTEVTRETLEDLFPDIAEELKQAGRDEVQEEMSEVSEAAALADMQNEEEAEEVAAAFAGKISAADLPKKLLMLRNKRKVSQAASVQDNAQAPEVGNDMVLQQMLDRRGQDQPAVAAAGGDMATKTNKLQATHDHLRKLRGGKRKRG